MDKVFLGMKNSIMSLYDGVRKTLKCYVEGEAKEENQEKEEEDVDLTLHEHKRALKGAYKFCDTWYT